MMFGPLRSIINGEQHEKYFYNQYSHYRKYGIIFIACTSFINLKVDVSLDYYVLFASSCSNMLCNILSKTTTLAHTSLLIEFKVGMSLDGVLLRFILLPAFQAYWAAF